MFAKRVEEVRERELYIIFKFALLGAFQIFAWTASMFWASVTCLTTVFVILSLQFLSTGSQTVWMGNHVRQKSQGSA